MLQQIIFAAVIILSLTALAAAAFSRSTRSGKWAVAAFAGALIYGGSSYISMFGTADSFIMTRGMALSALAVMSLSYIFALSEAGKVRLAKPARLGFTAVTLMFVMVMTTERIHGMCLFPVTVSDPDDYGVRTPVYHCKVLYYVVIALIALTAVVGTICVIAKMSKKTLKTPSSLKFLSVLSLFVLIGLTAGELAAEFMDIPMITPISVMIADLLLLLVISLDKSDMVEFGKSCGVDCTNDGIVVLDKKMNPIFANKTAKRLFVEFSESDPKKLAEFISTISGKESIDRGNRTYSFTKTKFIDHDGRCDCNIIMINDMTEQALRENRLSQEAAIDSITGLNSRSSVVDILTGACEETSGILINISFDGFKAFNNLYGHEEANKLLASFGAILRNNTNTDDIRGRLGGELFTIFFRNCTSESVVAHFTLRIEEQITDAMNKQLGQAPEVSIGVSVGGVHVPDAGREYEKLSEIATKELKKIRSSGGHGYSIYDPDPKEESSDDIPESTVTLTENNH